MTDEQKAYLEENFFKQTTAELKKNCGIKDRSVIYRYAESRGWIKPVELRKRTSFPKEISDEIDRRYPYEDNCDIAASLGLTPAKLRYYAYKRGLSKSKDYRPKTFSEKRLDTALSHWGITRKQLDDIKKEYPYVTNTDLMAKYPELNRSRLKFIASKYGLSKTDEAVKEAYRKVALGNTKPLTDEHTEKKREVNRRKNTVYRERHKEEANRRNREYRALNKDRINKERKKKREEKKPVMQQETIRKPKMGIRPVERKVMCIKNRCVCYGRHLSCNGKQYCDAYIYQPSKYK